MASLLPEDYSLDRMRRYYAHFSPTPMTPTSKIRTDAATIGMTTEAARLERQRKAAQVAEDYYDLVSPMYENGWGQRFHYTPLTPGLSISDSMTAYEKEFARITGLKKGMRVLDMGCGVGGPARSFAQLVGVEVVGITNSKWHVERGQALTKEAGLEGQVTFVQGDYMDASFDAAYAFEALCYCPDPTVVYKEAYRVLKPGGLFAFADWTMTDKFDVTQKEHLKIRNWIEYGNGVTRMPLVQEMRDGLKKTGFEVFHEEDMSHRSAPGPWYYGPAGNVRWAHDWKDFWKVFQMSPLFLFVVRFSYRILVLVGLCPKLALNVMDTMWYCCRSVAIGGKMGIFSPIYMFAGRKPNGK
ncbi:S-adenosyl-L-methionine-dependent methyltransferase [Podospora appendiculata]|uniref:Sterol 24-C-methyltransferase n=1 Tax=Podospora appendiculata TaxID=314037 RepID=A0AAE0X6W5_9PEZI|nr:S-adenosyl-L-methionine-dependent methyltransferase [Podospora appendiculata]